MDLFKNRLVEKMTCSTEEDVGMTATSSSGRRKMVSDQGLTYYGNPKSLDYIHSTLNNNADIVMKLKKNHFPLDTTKRRAALEEIAIFVQNQPANYLRHYGFVEIAIISLKSTDIEAQIVSLAIIAKLSQDEVLNKEIYDSGMFDIAKQLLVAQDDCLRLCALAVYESMCNYEHVKEKMLKKDMLMLVILLEECLTNNIIRGSYILWSIFSKTSTNKSCLTLLVESGLMKLVAPSLDLCNSQILTKNVLVAVKNVCAERSLFTVEAEPKIIESLLKHIQVSKQGNLLLIVDILGSLRIEAADGTNFDRCLEVVSYVLATGVGSPNNVKFTILKVINQLFTPNSKSIATSVNADRMVSVIMAALQHGTAEIKETACELTLKMIETQNIQLVKEPDLLGIILQHCKLADDEHFALRRKSIEIIYAMSTSVKYLSLVVINAYQVVDVLRAVLVNMHAEVAKVINAVDFERIQRLKQKANNIGDYISVHEEDLLSMSDRSRSKQFNDGNEGVVNDSFFSKNARAAEIIRQRRKKLRKKSVQSVDTENFFQDRSDVFSNFSDDDTAKKDPDYMHEGAFIEPPQINDMQNIIRQNLSKNKEINESTNKIIKILSILMSCDLVYSKIFALNYHSVFGIILEKMVAVRELELVDSILNFFCTMMDIVYFRNACSISEPLVAMIDIISKKFLIYVLRVIRRELDCKFSNWVILCSTINLIIRLLMKEETSAVMIRHSNLGPFLERIIHKGIEMKNPSIMMMATILATHLSIYLEFHKFMLIREFVAYAMGLLEPNSSEFLKNWTDDMNSKKVTEMTTSGDSLLFLNRIMSNTGIVAQLAQMLLNNLSQSSELAKILGSLPVKYGAKPLAKLFLIDRSKVSRLIQALCKDPDFQSKMASFVPVSYTVSDTTLTKAQVEDDAVEVEKIEEAENDAYDKMRVLINKPKVSKGAKPVDYHEKITKLVFLNSSMNDLIWRRLIKITMLNFKNDPLNSMMFTGTILKPGLQVIDYDKLQLVDILKDSQDAAAAGIYMPTGNQKEIAPEDSYSGIMESMGISAPLRAVNQGMLNTNTAMIEDYNRKQRVFDYKIEDFYYKDPKNKFGGGGMQQADNGDTSAVQRMDVKTIVQGELSRLNQQEE